MSGKNALYTLCVLAPLQLASTTHLRAGEGEVTLGDAHVFVPEKIEVLWKVGPEIYVGFLDAEGRFVCLRPAFSGTSITFTKMLPLVNFPRDPHDPRFETVYEYRSGLLVRGRLDDESGKFVPEVGSQVIALTDYRPGKGALRIYNLPGRIVYREKVAKMPAQQPKPPAVLLP